MATHSNQNSEFCERLKVLGYTHHARIRIYGEDFDLTSNPIEEDNGFAIEAVSRKSGQHRRLRIPIHVVQMIRNNLAATASREAA
jgi:hypothetical protein